jgi:hypothetical protein
MSGRSGSFVPYLILAVTLGLSPVFGASARAETYVSGPRFTSPTRPANLELSTRAERARVRQPRSARSR